MLRKILLLFLSFVIVLFGIYFHTNTLKVSHHSIQIGHWGKKIKIAQISDLHTRGVGRLERQLFAALVEERPDLIVITGDLTTPSGTYAGYEVVLKELKAPLGVYFVQGNWEYWEPVHDLVGLLKKNKITFLLNNAVEIDNYLWLIGLDDSIEGQPQFPDLEKAPKDAAKIALFHEPQFFQKSKNIAELNLAGHTHGGQIRFPFLGALWYPKGTGNYQSGWYKEGRSHLFVSRGIGTSLLPIRFNCSPELAIIDVNY